VWRLPLTTPARTGQWRKMQQDTATSTTFKPRVRFLGDHRYLIESRTTRGVGHVTNAQRNTCTCMAGKRGMARCWHRALAVQIDRHYAGWMQGQTTPARPANMAALQEAFA